MSINIDTIIWPGQFIGTFLKNHGLPAADKWYEHEPERVVEKSDKAKLLWDFSIQTDYEIQSRRSDIGFLSKEGNQCFIVDIAVPGDARIAEKEKEKIEKKS